jgi:2-succinyl-6-hydroxy-2,4-cyclohexadiene-1-carboxylate synthase
VTLHAERDGSGPRLVLVHGFTQTRRSWGDLAVDLSRDHEVVRVDAPGHGRSAQVAVGVEAGARLLGDAGGRATYVGYSMGGRLALRLAVDRPALVERLVLVSATAGIDDPEERAARRAADEAQARRLEAGGLDAFLADWLDQPLFAGLSEATAGLEARGENTVAGLASSLRLAGTGAQPPLWSRLGELAMPVLAVAGGDDTKFVALARRLAAAVGANASVAVLEGAGHAVHLEQPGAFLATLRAWLTGAVSPPGDGRPRGEPPRAGRRRG